MSGVFLNQDITLAGLKIKGITLGVHYKPAENSYIRLEGRDLMISGEQKIFRWDNENKNYRIETILNMSVTFPKNFI